MAKTVVMKCKYCGIQQEIPRLRGRIPEICKRCKQTQANKRAKGWRRANPQRDKELQYKARLKSLYGLTVEEANGLKTNGCNVCGSRKKLCFDHDHTTGILRGVLCDACNIAIGRLGNSPETLRTLADYLEATAASPEDVMRAVLVHAQTSHDPSTQNGAVLAKKVSDHLYLPVDKTKAVNQFPLGVAEAPERWERPLKYSMIEHAERGSVFAAARSGVKTNCLTLFCPWFACADCARAIIQAGIEEVVGLDNERLGGIDGFPNSDVAKRWDDTCRIGLEMLKEAGVYTRWITGDFGVRILRGGEVLTV